MRKYQQLILLVCSCICIIVLLMYKNENNRLKYVLQVVNFFGRNDAALIRRVEKNISNEDVALSLFEHPLPVWQKIGESFHAYSVYWSRNELVAGGDVIAIVSGARGAVVNFRCTLQYESGVSIQGKFRFQRLDNSTEDANSDFTSYSFFCRVMRDFGQPELVTFTDVTSASKTTHALRMRYIKNAGGKEHKSAQFLTTICLDMVNYNSSSYFGRNTTNLLQFFLHHKILGIDNFVVYNGDAIPHRIMQLLQHINVHLHLLPFNFPFSHVNATERIRRLIEIDCLMRNTHLTKHTILLEANEFFFPNAKLDKSQTVIRSLNHYSAEVFRFALPTFAMCMDPQHKLLVDNTLYDPEVPAPHTIFLYRPQVPLTTTTDVSTVVGTNSISLPLSLALTHRYVGKCENVGKDGLHDWRTSLREDFMQNIINVRNELNLLI